MGISGSLENCGDTGAEGSQCLAGQCTALPIGKGPLALPISKGPLALPLSKGPLALPLGKGSLSDLGRSSVQTKRIHTHVNRHAQHINKSGKRSNKKSRYLSSSGSSTAKRNY